MDSLMSMPALAGLPLWVVPAALVHLVFFLVLLIPTWRAFGKAELPGVAALMLIVPVLGWIGVAVLLATTVLRKAGWPVFLCVAALIPLVNIVFMYMLAGGNWGDIPQMPVARPGPPRFRPAARQPSEVVVDTIVAQQVDTPSGRPTPTAPPKPTIAEPQPTAPPAVPPAISPAMSTTAPPAVAPADAPTQMPSRLRAAAEQPDAASISLPTQADAQSTPAPVNVAAAPSIAASSNDTFPPIAPPPEPSIALPDGTASLVFTSPPVVDAPPPVNVGDVNTDPPQVPPRAANDPAPRPQRPRPTEEPGPLPPHPRMTERPKLPEPPAVPPAAAVPPAPPQRKKSPDDQVVPMQRTPGPSIAAKARMEQPPTVINLGRGRHPEQTEREWKFSGNTAAQGNFQLLLQEKSVRDAPDGIILGRSTDRASMVVRDESVSRAHIRFLWRRGAVHVEDLESLNGTYVDGQRLLPGTSAELLDETELEVGKIKLLVRRT